METLLQTAERGDLPRLIERLKHAIQGHCSGRRPMDIGEQLLDEALFYARQGDIREAALRLRLRAQPKWSSQRECAAAYKKAMKEQAKKG